MRFVKESIIRATPRSVFAFHELPDALERLTPPGQKVRIIQTANISEIGSRAIFDLRILGPYNKRWIAEHIAYEPPHFFEDVQIKGPFKVWRHRHVIKSHPEGSLLRDEIDYEPPFGRIGELVFRLSMGDKLERSFEYRHEITRRWCEAE